MDPGLEVKTVATDFTNAVTDGSSFLLPLNQNVTISRQFQLFVRQYSQVKFI